MKAPGYSDVHLAYCLNVHPAQTIEQMEQAVFGDAIDVFRRLGRRATVGHPHGVGMWFARPVCDVLLDPARRLELRDRLRESGLYVFTLNGFPFGTFHGESVKESVYRPDWSDPERARYTTDLATVLADLLDTEKSGSISTVPVTYGDWADERTVLAAVAQLTGVAVFLGDLEADTGKQVSLALEPEPDCCFESGAGAVRFFEERLLPHGAELLRRDRGLSTESAEELLRRHLGICLDTVHSAVVDEDPVEALSLCSSAGVGVFKIQLGAALWFRGDGDAARVALEPFADSVYLHQTRCVSGRSTERFRDLPEALAALDDSTSEIWVHYHTPLAWMGRELGSAGAECRGVVTPELLSHAIACGTEHFEVEVYTLDVLPGADETTHELLAGELAWVLEQLEAARPG